MTAFYLGGGGVPGDFDALGSVLTRYWRCKMFLSEGANPEPEVYRRIAQALEKHILGYVSVRGHP